MNALKRVRLTIILTTQPETHRDHQTVPQIIVYTMGYWLQRAGGILLIIILHTSSWVVRRLGCQVDGSNDRLATSDADQAGCSGLKSIGMHVTHHRALRPVTNTRAKRGPNVTFFPSAYILFLMPLPLIMEKRWNKNKMHHIPYVCQRDWQPLVYYRGGCTVYGSGHGLLCEGPRAQRSSAQRQHLVDPKLGQHWSVAVNGCKCRAGSR
jgi:hypothetical protein